MPGGNRVGENHTGGSPGDHLRTSGEGYSEEMARTEDTLTEAAKLRRHLFVTYLIKHQSPTAAAKAAGFKSPGTKGLKLLREPYVQELKAKLIKDLELDAIMSCQEIMYQLKNEAMNFNAGNQGARVAALANMAKIHNMMENHNKAKSQSILGGVMVVPGVPSVDDWETMAKKSQEDLKSAVRD